MNEHTPGKDSGGGRLKGFAALGKSNGHVPVPAADTTSKVKETASAEPSSLTVNSEAGCVDVSARVRTQAELRQLVAVLWATARTLPKK